MHSPKSPNLDEAYRNGANTVLATFESYRQGWLNGLCGRLAQFGLALTADVDRAEFAQDKIIEALFLALTPPSAESRVRPDVKVLTRVIKELFESYGVDLDLILKAMEDYYAFNPSLIEALHTWLGDDFFAPPSA